MKQRMTVTVRGKQSEWSFPFDGDPQHLQGWLADGLEVYCIENTVPMWVVNLGLSRAWIAGQDAWRFMRLF